MVGMCLLLRLLLRLLLHLLLLHLLLLQLLLLRERRAGNVLSCMLHSCSWTRVTLIMVRERRGF